MTEDGPWASDTVTNTYTDRLRTGLGVQQPSGNWRVSYAYDLARRLTNVTSRAGSFTNYYHDSRHLLVKKLGLPGGAYITNDFDSVGRMLFTKLNTSAHATLNSHSYIYNVGNQRTKQTFTDDNYVDYTYDGIGQLKTATGKEAGGTTRLHEKLGYTYDEAGNLNYRTNNALVQTFNVDELNQLSTVTRSGTKTKTCQKRKRVSPHY